MELKLLSLYFCLNVVLAKPYKPHIIFIFADDLGWYDVPWHNNIVVAPTLQSLASTGVILEQSYSMHLCTPSRAAFLTGRYPFRTGRQHYVLGSLRPTGLSLNETLLPELLKEANYESHIIGKWQCGFCKWDYTPTNRGFDTHYGFLAGQQDYITHENVVTDDVDGELTTLTGYDFRLNEEINLEANGSYSTFDYVNYANDVLKSRNESVPLFLFLSFQNPHTPLMVPQSYDQFYDDVQDHDRSQVLRLVTVLNDAVENLLDVLKSTGHYNNSVIIFTSDNGGDYHLGSNNYPLRGEKASLWEGGIRSSTFVHSPMLSINGRSSDALLHITDWTATILSLANVTSPIPLDGFDQWDAISGVSQSKRSEVVYNIDEIDCNAAIRVGDYKLIQGNIPQGDWIEPPEWNTSFNKMDSSKSHNDALNCEAFENIVFLFNIKDDPEERTDLSLELPEKVQELLTKLNSYKEQVVPADFPPNVLSGDPNNFGGAWSPGWC